MDLLSLRVKWTVLTFLTLSSIPCLHTATNENNIAPTSTSSEQYTTVKAGASPQVQINVTTPKSIEPSSEDQISSRNQNEFCPDGVECHKLGAECIECNLNTNCQYGNKETAQCTVKSEINCTGKKTFNLQYECKYCYQLDPSLYTCNSSSTCTVVTAPSQTFIAKCQVKSEVICLGKRQFHKSLPCNWTSGYKWSTALLLSVTLGGFGVDRFYLGLWREGIGKLFSFGGLGVWTLVDVILIAIGYVGPSDGSLYI
ncbi:TM2 domain-containing protein 3-like [Ylistrum balloti]|uniref:TM2 domain-containing protein 3-like n=1 Tax=Ylistrum balloti TaxID=509963 RepID=UPI0029059877|nr:TM2 domain-containing protein 3-like [Ylistrum balloti]